MIESIGTNNGYAVRNGESGEIGAVGKSKGLNSGYTVGNDNAGKILATIEGTAATTRSITVSTLSTSKRTFKIVKMFLVC